MIWILLLCHFIGDYPLQTDAMVLAKRQFLGLTLHVAIHFITLLVVIVGLLRADLVSVLPGIFALTGFHFAIDTWKNILYKLRPDWTIFSYLQDQILHIVSMLLVALWMESGAVTVSTEPANWIIPILGLILATNAWFVTEYVLFSNSPEYQRWVTQHSWRRMIGRGLMFGAWFIGWNFWALLTFCVGLFYHWLDLAGPFRFRALLIDISVVVSIVLGLFVAN